MREERWQRVKEIFHEALERRDAAARRRYLDEACAGDEDLLGEVRSLLEHDDGPSVEDPEGRGSLSAFFGSGDGAGMPARIGPYRPLGRLGRGGSGTVYLAVRDDGHFRKRVAIKVIRRGMDTDDILRRFERERQILAGLEHPNIAHLLDGGATEDGVPYFVMEHVEGVPIDRYCDRELLSVDERLRLFCTVAAAVHHAHQNLVVHRDLKPANILVSAEGVPKLVDFGIAKLLNAELSGQAVDPTTAGERLLTPEYASPEQWLGQTVTTASDVYSLGVLLHRLLTGRRWHADRAPAPGEGEEKTDEELAALRRTKPKRLRRRLRGDLEKILAMALRREPRRRYPSAQELANDLRRHLRGQAVVARKDTLGSRLSSLVRRHRLASALAAALVVVLLAGVWATLWQARRAFRERARVEELLLTSETERRRAEQISDFLVDLFEVADPRGTPDVLSAREILDRGAEALSRELADQPQVRVPLLNTVGRIYQNLGLYREAVPILEEALAVGREHLGEEHLEVAASLNQLAQVLDLQGEEAAEGLYRQALALRRERLEAPHADLAESLLELGELLLSRGQLREAADLIEEALAMRRELHGPHHPTVAESLQVLAVLSHEKGDLARAFELYRRALALRRSHFGAEHPEVARTLASLSALHRNRGEYARAQALVREALGIQRRRLGDRHPAVAGSLNQLGLILGDRGDHAAAERTFREVLERWREAFGERHPTVGQALNNIGWALHRQGEAAAAQPFFEQALDLWRGAYGGAHPSIPRALANLAGTLRDQGRPRAAEPLLREALRMHRELLMDRHPYTALLLDRWAWTLYLSHDHEGAEAAFREALSIAREVLPAGHAEIGGTLVGLGITLIDQGRAREALPHLEEGVKIRASALPPDDWRRAWDQQALGRCWRALGRHQDAERLIRSSHRQLAGRADVPEVLRRLSEELFASL